MKNLLVLGVASLIATSAMAGDMKWNGSAGMRYQAIGINDGLSSTNTAASGIGGTSGSDLSGLSIRKYQIRANLGVRGGWENVEYGVGIRTQGNSGTGNVVNTDFSTFAGATDSTVGLEQAWFKYFNEFAGAKVSVTIGRGAAVFLADGYTENLFANALRLNGLGWNFNYGMFGLNLGQYVLGTRGGNASYEAYTANSQSSAANKTTFSALYGFQGFGKWKFADEIDTTLALGFYKYSNVNGFFTNWSAGGTSPLSQNTAGNGASVAANTAWALKMDNPQIWQVYNQWKLPYNLMFTGEIAWNKTVAENTAVANWSTAAATTNARKTAWAISLLYGPAMLKKAHDFHVGAAYGVKGIGSVVGATSSPYIAPDNKYIALAGGYALADSFTVGVKAGWLTELEKMNSTTGTAYNGANAGQNTKTSLFELNAGVSF